MLTKCFDAGCSSQGRLAKNESRLRLKVVPSFLGYRNCIGTEIVKSEKKSQKMEKSFLA